MKGFNPRPPFRTGATGPVYHGIVDALEFQSSPALSDGRYLLDTLRGGGDKVSILARPFGRALRS